MILPKLISIDTSIFGDFAKDYFSNKKERRDKAQVTLQFLIENGFIPFISFHHITEILQHDDDEVIYKRWALIKRFPTIAWLCSYGDPNVLGSIFDIQVIETKLFLEEPTLKISKLIDEVNNKYIRYTSGIKFVENFEHLYSKLREDGHIDLQRGKEIESLCHVSQADNVKLSDLDGLGLKNPDEITKYLSLLELQLTKTLEQSGDQKLSGHKEVATTFIKGLRERGNKLYLDKSPLIENLVNSAGVRLDQVTPKTTIRQLGYLGIFNARNRLILESIGVSLKHETKISPDKLVNWILWEHFDRTMKHEKRASGSNMQDKYMAIFSLFVDVLTVDKRIHEYFRQFITKNPTIPLNHKKIVKTSNYSDLINIIT